MTDLGNIDSKYRFVIIASKRAKEILKGAKVRVKTRSKNPIRIAQKEVEMGLVDFEILKSKEEDVSEREERVFLGEEIGVEPIEEGAADISEIFGEAEEAGEEEEGEKEEEEAGSSEDQDEEEEEEGGEEEEED